MSIVTKSAEASVSVVESENPNGEFDVILSTEALDRDGEKLFIDEWKTPLPDRITFDSDHGMSVATTVGSGVPSIEDGALRVRGTFASTAHAQNVRTLVNEGHITKTSVAFRTIRDKKSQSVSRELLNGAFVAVPANEEARVLSSKAATLVDDEKTDPRMILAGVDAVLDQALALCAGCDREALPPEITQAIDLLYSVGPTVDELLEMLGIHDPDEDSSPAGEEEDEGEYSAEKSAADADTLSAAAADDSAERTALRGRALAFLVTKTSTIGD